MADPLIVQAHSLSIQVTRPDGVASQDESAG